MGKKLLDVQQLSVSFGGKGTYQAVNNVSFSIHSGEIVALLGMSGSGKTLTALSILQLLSGRGAVSTTGTILYDRRGELLDLCSMSETELQHIRGKEIGLVFQNGQQALNPSMICGKQIEEAILAHKPISKANAKQEVLQLFDEMDLPLDCYNKFPHQLSGGQQQRILIAIAVCCKPTLIVADEPTASLDKQTQQEVTNLLLKLCRQRHTALLLITHDLSLVSEVADRVMVMHEGRVVEENTIHNILYNPQHSYTKLLVECYNQLHNRPCYADPEDGSALLSKAESSINPLLKVEKLSASFVVKNSWLGSSKRVQVLKELNMEIGLGETLGLLGNSGSGKTTLAKILLALQKPDAGTMVLDGLDLSAAAGHNQQHIYKKVQMVFQDAHAALNPRFTIAACLLEPMRYHKLEENEEQRKHVVDELFSAVGLDKSLLYAYPHELSGGQRQRVALARSLALRPQLLVLDEPVASLDAVTQLQVLDLLKELKNRYSLSYLFISHDIHVLKYMSNRIVEMVDGKLFHYQESSKVYI